jgi:hypothetical protein
MNILQHKAAAAAAAIENAKTPMQKHVARRDGLAVKAELEKQIGDDAALEVFKKTKPQSSFGVWKGGPVSDRPIFMTGPAGTKITAPIALPDGTKAAPNPLGQIVVPARFEQAMIVRGFVRANSVTTALHTTTDAVAQLNTVGQAP